MEGYFFVMSASIVMLSGVCVLLAMAMKDWRDRYWALSESHMKLRSEIRKAAAQQSRRRNDPRAMESSGRWKQEIFSQDKHAAEAES